MTDTQILDFLEQKHVWCERLPGAYRVWSRGIGVGRTLRTAAKLAMEADVISDSGRADGKMNFTHNNFEPGLKFNPQTQRWEFA